MMSTTAPIQGEVVQSYEHLYFDDQDSPLQLIP